MLVRMEPDHLNNTLNTIETTWKQFTPGEPFDYNFMDASFDALYRSEQRMGKVFFIFTILSLFIACFGLFGLSAYVAERRIKEIEDEHTIVHQMAAHLRETGQLVFDGEHVLKRPEWHRHEGELLAKTEVAHVSLYYADPLLRRLGFFGDSLSTHLQHVGR